MLLIRAGTLVSRMKAGAASTTVEVPAAIVTPSHCIALLARLATTVITRMETEVAMAAVMTRFS
jgi:hypothetical protein